MKAIVLNTLVIVVVTTGTAIIPLIGEASTGVEPLKSIFLAFVSAIVVIQLIPALMLLGGFMKATLASDAKKQEGGL